MGTSIAVSYPAHEQATISNEPYWKIFDDRRSRTLYRVLAPLAFLIIAIALYMALWYAPREATMGDAQRIFYFHVPSAWIGFLAFFIVFVSSILYLLKGERKWDSLALSAAEIGVVFTTLVLLTGPIWAKAAWGAFWVWDARLTTTLILWFIYIGYLTLRATVDDVRKARLAAVLGIVGFLDVPVIYLSVTVWRTMHPTLLIYDSNGLAPAMTQTLIVALASFTLLFALLLVARIRLEQKRDALAAKLAQEA
jgi:heme exporter protein C